MKAGREWVGLVDRYGPAGEAQAWGVAYQHYLWDRLEQAREAADALGAGEAGLGLFTYRMIEAEYLTRQSAEVTPITDWLELEAHPGASAQRRGLAKACVAACDDVARMFGYAHGPATRITILAEAAITPWTPGAHGFCVDKYPFEKICLPAELLHDPENLAGAIRHEYAHAMAINRSQGRCPLWLDEAIAMVADGAFDEEAWREFADGKAEFYNAEDLESAFHDDRDDPEGRDEVWYAYQQASILGEYLGETYGEQELGRLLDSIGSPGVFGEVMRRLRADDPAEPALRKVYGFGIAELFERAIAWLREES